MATRRNTKNNKDTYQLNADIGGILLIALGLFSLISLVQPSFAGILGIGLYRFLLILFGLGSVVFPFICCFIGYCYIKTSGSLKFHLKFYGILLFILSILMIIQRINFLDYYTGDFKEGLKLLFYSNSKIHGGIISYLILIPLNNLVGELGSYIFIFALFIVASLMISEKSLKDFFAIFANKKSPNKQKNIKNSIPTEEPKIVEDTHINDNHKENRRKIKLFTFDVDKDEETQNSQVQGAEDLGTNKNNTEVTGTKKNVQTENYSKELKKEEETSIDFELEIKTNSIKEEINYNFPALELLNENNSSKLNKNDKKELLASATKLEETLNSFGVDAKVLQVSRGPAVTRYEIQPSAGVKVSKIVNLADDIALNLAASGVRIEAPIPGKAAVGIEVPNKDVTAVYLKEVIESNTFLETNKRLAFALGKDISGACVVADLTKMPHLLIAGATGSGKSVCINTLIISLLYKYSPDDVKLLMIDPKVVELSIYNGIPHLLIPVVTNPKKAAGALNWAVNEMVKRYQTFADNNVRNIEGYNELFNKGKVQEKMQCIVIIIDELADLMMVCPNDIEDYIARLAQMARAAGMHLVIATQRPSVDVITGVIKANIPSRISFAVSSQIDSRTILDSSGAEKLLGKGDMLYYPVGESKPLRVQGAFVSEEEVENIVNFIKDQQDPVEYKEEIIEHINTPTSSESSTDDFDELLDEATRIVIESGQASTSLLQRRLRIGYNRAARIIDQLELKGIISAKDGSKPRNILVGRVESDID
ncbi:FtsK/SpoIIIE family DNA translocase [Clostridium cellulovorans]|uniref:Cell divisionFtsK/SpoIIIE n=1 Tax=Clostridium cellulovorans (strain ATCC 35296 / DSM 3052 / OCM 3 / 743B) TaxID=573061 RepID=D9SMU2_CLOC7|nr:DNA translocase FtsK [Clostridium cellulovorans]ADL51808.1 cell divisionFtsK/SpoIIIE [Clostridium cellulovorans 743B]